MHTDSLHTLVSQRPRFLSFVRARVHDAATAEDILQAAYARAIEQGGTVEPQRRVAWLEAVEVSSMPAVSFAATHGIPGGNATVRLHRARRLLAQALEGICGSCTLDGCSDCDCASASPPPPGL